MHSRWKSSTVTSSGPDLMLADDHKVATQSRNPRRAVDLTRRTPGSIRGALARAGPGASEEPPLRKRKPRVPPSRRASAGFRLVLSFPPSTPPSIPRPTPNADRRRTNFQAPHPQKTPNQGLPPRWKIRDFPPGATARFIGQGEPETNQIELSKRGREHPVTVSRSRGPGRNPHSAR